MSGWVRVAEESDIPEGHSRGFTVEGRDIGLFNVGGDCYAMDNVCPHRGAILSDGRTEGARVACPWHGWAFDVRNGGWEMDPHQRQQTFPVEKRDGGIYVKVEGGPTCPAG